MPALFWPKEALRQSMESKPTPQERQAQNPSLLGGALFPILCQWIWQGVQLDQWRIQQAEQRRNVVGGREEGMPLSRRERSSLLGPGFQEELALVLDGLCEDGAELSRHQYKLDANSRLGFEPSAFRILASLFWRWFRHEGSGSCLWQAWRMPGQEDTFQVGWAISAPPMADLQPIFQAAFLLAAHHMGARAEESASPDGRSWRLRAKPTPKSRVLLLQEPSPLRPLVTFLAQAPFPWIRRAWSGQDILKMTSNQGRTLLLGEESLAELDNLLFLQPLPLEQASLPEQCSRLVRLIECDAAPGY
jgi:hypothetical protein